MSDKKVTVKAAGVVNNESSETFAPLVDIYDEDGVTVLVADVPGAETDSLDVRVDKGVLTIEAQGRLDDPGEDYAPTYRGFVGGQYFRAFALGDEVDRDKIDASLENGVLKLRLPKAATAETRKIEIKEE